MSLSKYLIIMTIGTLGSLACLVLAILTIDPFATNWLGLSLFYASLMVTVTGLVSIIGFVCRFVLLHNKLAVSAVIISFRQAFVIALLLALTLFLLAHQLFSWLNMSLLIIGFTVLEFILISLSLHHDE
jgi:hypothetical protein